MLEFKNIYEMYNQDVFKYLISLTHNPTLSEDLVSDTFLSAIKSLPNFKGNSDIKTWLFSIARYKWFEYLRKKKDIVSFNDLADHYILDETDLGKSLLRNELTNKILYLLDQEPTKVKDVILMRIEGYSFYEISIKLNISESSARVIDFRGKKTIREILEKEDLTYE